MKAAESETRRLVMVRRTGSLEGIRFSFGLVPINALDADRTDQLSDGRNLPLQGYGRVARNMSRTRLVGITWRVPKATEL